MIQTMIKSSIQSLEPTHDAAQSIVDAAQRLFIRDGVDATSLRAVTREAGVNVAAIHYYFGSRDELLRSVLDRIVTPVNRHRHELLDSALKAHKGGPIPVRETLRAFLLPDLEAIESLRDSGVAIAHFVARCYAAPSPPIKRMMDEQFGQCADRFLDELARALPDIDRDELAFRFRCLIGVIVAMLGSARPRDATGALDTADIPKTLARLIAFLGAGLIAAPAAKSLLALHKSKPSADRRRRH